MIVNDAAEKANESLRQVVESSRRIKESIGKFSVEEDIKRKIVDIYNYMARHNVKKMGTQFENGIKFSCEIDDSERKDIPTVTVDE